MTANPQRHRDHTESTEAIIVALMLGT
jgi:hypothetical protein